MLRARVWFFLQFASFGFLPRFAFSKKGFANVEVNGHGSSQIWLDEEGIH
jgi:hypothetical protein